MMVNYLMRFFLSKILIVNIIDYRYGVPYLGPTKCFGQLRGAAGTMPDRNLTLLQKNLDGNFSSPT
jgi:hypothetical protein